MKFCRLLYAVILTSTIFIIGCEGPFEIKDDLKWELKIDGDIEVCPAVGSDGTIYFGTTYGYLYSVNPNGSKNWQYDLGYSPTSAPAIGADGIIYIVAQGVAPSTYILPYLYAMRPNGSLKWRHLLGSTSGLYCHCSPAIGADGTIYAGTDLGDFFAISPDDSIKWVYHLAQPIYSSPAIGEDGTIYFGCNDSCLYAINPDGTLKWRYLTGGSVTSSPAIDAQGILYFSSPDQYLYALDANGTLQWRFNVYDNYYTNSSCPSIGIDGTIYYDTYSHDTLYAIDPNGTLKWRYPTTYILSLSFCPTVCSDSTVLVYAYHSEYHYCFGAVQSDGTMRWYIDNHIGNSCNMTIGADSTIYAGSEVFTSWTTSDFYLYALKGKAVLANSPWPKFHHDLKNTGLVGGF